MAVAATGKMTALPWWAMQQRLLSRTLQRPAVSLLGRYCTRTWWGEVVKRSRRVHGPSCQGFLLISAFVKARKPYPEVHYTLSRYQTLLLLQEQPQPESYLAPTLTSAKKKGMALTLLLTAKTHIAQKHLQQYQKQALLKSLEFFQEKKTTRHSFKRSL